MAFHDVLLPDEFQYSSLTGAGFSTIIQETSSGHETRVARQAQARHKFRLVKSDQTSVEAKAIKAFALARRGSLHSFKLRDIADYTSKADGESACANVDQAIGIGDGVRVAFQLIKTYDQSTPLPYVRTISLPKSGTVVVAIDGVNTTSFSVGSTGIVTFVSAPTAGQIITAGYEFYVPVRFELGFDQWCQLQADYFDGWSIPGLDCVEVLSEVEQPERRSHGGQTTYDPLANPITLTLNDGELIYVNPSSAAVSVFLPQTSRVPGGPRLFTIAVKSGAAGTVQVRDDVGNAVGSPIAAGATKCLGLARTGSTATWVIY
jgi:uncharacterized protein (TIGR02217 family)